ncbi:hypothetical protein [Arthrobacter sp. B6]|nr:hypothetical protein [Arthrobacter sp. B6]
MQLINPNVPSAGEPATSPKSYDDDDAAVETLIHTAWVGWQYAVDSPQQL